MIKSKTEIKKKRCTKLRKSILAKIRGTAERPRIIIIKSNKYLYAQIVDDSQNRVIAGATTACKELKENLKSFKGKEAAKELGKRVADILLARQVKQAVFDRNYYAYSGKVKDFADIIREKGIQI